MIEVTPNTNSGDFYQVIDAFTTDGRFLSLGNATGFIYYQNATVSDGWTCGAQPGNVGGGFCWTFSAGDTWGGSFTGSLFELFGHPDAEDGSAQVWIDRAPYTTITPTFGYIDDDALASYPMLVGTLAPGDHTIQIIANGDGATQIDSLVSFQ
jgi:hypothetical protein